MNANELANELERPNNYQQENNFTTRAATMLRQQQAEIAALKEQLTQITAEDKKLFEAVQRANDVWNKATGKKP